MRPREYQESIAKNVLEKGSTLVVLPTGLGKTFIAMLVIKEKLKEGKVLFLAPSRPLVGQHAKSIQETLGINEVEVVTGLLIPDKRQDAYSRSRIVCATPQCVENDLAKGIIDLSEYSLVVFDEAHRAVGDYAYVSIASEYYKNRDNAVCLALTASPGSDKKKIEEVKKNLGIVHVETRTESDADVAKYVHEKKMKIVELSFPEEYKQPFRMLKQVRKEHANWLKEKNVRARTKTDLLKLQKSLSKRVSENPAFYQIISRIAVVIKLDYLISSFVTQGPEQALAYYRSLSEDGSKAAARIYEDPKVKDAMRLIEQAPEHPKLGKVAEILSAEKAEKAIVFSNYRDTAGRIEHFLTQKGFSCKRFIGQASRAKEKGYSQKEQAEILEKFRAGEIKVLVATSIGEEGLDIPSVDLAVFYEPVPSAIRMIQRKGRTGRHGPGKIYVLMTRNTLDQVYYWSSYNKEKKMKRSLKDPQKKVGEFV